MFKVDRDWHNDSHIGGYLRSHDGRKEPERTGQYKVALCFRRAEREQRKAG